MGRPHRRVRRSTTSPVLIGVSEPSLQRALSELRARDVIGSRYRRLVVRDVDALRVLD